MVTRKTLKFIIPLKTCSRTSLDDDQADFFASLLLSTQLPSLWLTKKRQPNTTEEVEATKEFEQALKDRVEGKNM